jgi:hypothetical protein
MSKYNFIGKFEIINGGYAMEIIEYFSSGNKEHWISEIGKSDWGAGHFLKKVLKKSIFPQTTSDFMKNTDMNFFR